MRSILILILLLSFNILSQIQYPDTLWIPVNYYDFHSNKSNPEFECPHSAGRHLNMVNSQLKNEIPAPGTNPYINYRIKNWFSDWNDSGKGDFTVPKYTRINGGEWDAVIRYDGDTTISHDTTFKNVVIKDSLPFMHIYNGMYRYENDAFFPIDGRGFGSEGKNHNFSFTMVLHQSFVKKNGQNFRFSGDDDFWVFIDNKLKMDIGGIHQEISDIISIDSFPELVNGKSYNMDVFFAERHSTSSHISITTNIINHFQEPVGSYNIVLYPETAGSQPCPRIISDTIGATYRFYAKAFDNSSIYDSTIAVTWQILKDASFDSSRITISGNHVTISFENYFAESLVAECPFCEYSFPDTITFYSIPPVPQCHLSIELDRDTTALDFLRHGASFDTITISVPKSQDTTVYPIIRDKYENFIKLSNNTIHLVTDTSIVALNATANSIMIIPKITGTTMVIASDTAYDTNDTFFVKVNISDLSGTNKNSRTSPFFTEDDKSANSSLMIYNILGKRVFNGTTKTGSSILHSLNDLRLSEGVYFIKIRGKNEQIVSKMFIIKGK